MKRAFLVAMTLLALPIAALGQAQTYEIDPAHSQVGFSVRHFVSNVPGRFTDYAGTMQYDPKNPQNSSVQVTVQAKSINTDNAKRDDHLRGEDFFDVGKYPTLSFKSRSVRQTGPTRLVVVGDFTMHGVTKQLTVPVTIAGPMNTGKGSTIGAEAEFTVNRKDYGINWNRALDDGGAVLGDDVTIRLNFEGHTK